MTPTKYVSIVMYKYSIVYKNMPVSIHAFSEHPEVCRSEIAGLGFVLKLSRKEKKKKRIH